MRALLTALCGGLLLTACVSTALPSHISEMVAASVLVSDDSGHGTGTLIGPSTILTAGHVASENTDFTITFSDGRKAHAKTQWVGDKYDMALLRLDAPQEGAVDIDCSPLKLGERFFFVGNPSILKQNLTLGYVSSTTPSGNDDMDGAKLVPVASMFNPGDSGSGIFSDAGEVRGIVIAFLYTMIGPIPSQSGNGLVMPASVVCEELGLK